MTQFWEKTIQVFGSFVDYPQLTEKYLKRPPFKYIFQIFLTLNSKTGFARDAFKEPELNPDFYDTPEKKMVFLKQAVRIVYEGSSKQCPLKPQNVIKGTECEATNEFLQDMYFAAVGFENGKKANPAAETKGRGAEAREAVARPQPAAEPPQAQTRHDKEGGGAQQAKVAVAKREAPTDTQKATHHGKENTTEKSAPVPEAQKKTVQQVCDDVSKDEKLMAKPRVNSGTPGENGIKMGKLAMAPQANPKQPGEALETDYKEATFDEIKSVLQKLTQNTNPIGKLVEFVDDDLEAMNRECKKWLKTFGETQEKLQRMEEEQDGELQNFHASLNEINEQIFDYENRIASARSRVQKNNAKIDLMLSKVIG